MRKHGASFCAGLLESIVTPLEHRAAVTRATARHFAHKKFKWGACDCWVVVAWHLKNLGRPVPAVPRYSNAIGARNALKSMGAADVYDLLGRAGLEEIPPAAALPGDIISLASESLMGALSIYIGNGVVMAFHEDHSRPVMIKVADWQRAWRALPVSRR